MPPRRIRKLGGSTDESVHWLNNPNAGTRNLPDPKKRRVTNETSVYDLPVSPERPRRQPQNERNLRSRRVPTRREPSPNESGSDEEEDEKDQEDPSDAEPESDIEVADATDAPTPIVVVRNVHKEEVNSSQDHQAAENENEADPFPGPIELFTTEEEDTPMDDAVNGDGDQVDNDSPSPDDSDSDRSSLSKVEYLAGDIAEAQADTEVPSPGSDAGSDVRPDTESSGNDQDSAGIDDETGPRSQSGDESPGADALDPEFEADWDNEPFAETQTNADSTPNSHSSGEVQIPESSVETRPHRLQPAHMPSNTSQSLQTHSSQPQEILETPAPKTHSFSNEGNARPRHEIFTWMANTIKTSGFERTWDVLRQTRTNVKRKADPSMRERFTHIRKMKSRIQSFYEEMTHSDTPTIAMRDHKREQCTLIANNIFNELQWIIFNEARVRSPEGGALVNQVEAHVIPWLIELVYFGFRAWKTWNEKEKINWGMWHFRISLDLLWGSSYKITAWSDMTYGERNVPTPLRGLMPAVKAIKDALNDGRLRELGGRRPKPPYRHFELTEVGDNISIEPWSRVEKDALRKAFESAVLNGFEGEKSLHHR